MAKMNNDEYNAKVESLKGDYRSLNRFVMEHTYEMCQEEPLSLLTEGTKAGQYVLYEKDPLFAVKDGPTTNIVISSKRTLEAARQYYLEGKTVAVLNFANNHCPGGSPYYAGAQEESLCRITNLYPCLLKEKETFYQKHSDSFKKGLLDYMGNSDLIYTSLVTVFKTDESAPKMLEKKDWYLVNVITCAAPELYEMPSNLKDYKNSIILPRLRRVFEVAKGEGVQVLVLGAWGCGAFNNPPRIIAEAFKELCGDYHFDTIEFAIDTSRGPNANYEVFKETFDK